MKRIYIFLLPALLFQQTIIPQWVQTSGPYGGHISTIFINGTNIFAGTGGFMGGYGGIFRSTNNGGTWTAVNSGLPTRDVEVEVIASSGDGNDLFAGIPSAGIFRSTDNGSSWAEMNSGLPDSKLVTSFAFNSNNIFTSLYYGGVFRSDDNGTNWVYTGLDTLNITALALSPDGKNLFAITYGNLSVFLSTDTGASWSSVSSGLPGFNIPVSIIVSGTDIFFGSYYNGVFHSTNNGTSWTRVSSGLNSNLHALTIVDTNLFAATENGVYLSTNKGVSWTSIGLVDKGISTIAASTNPQGGTNIFAGSPPADGIFLSTDIGTTWTEANNGLSNININTFAISSNQIGDTFLYAGSNRSGVFLSTNNGSTWTAINSGLPSFKDVNSLAVNGSNIFAGTGEGVFLSTDNGANWSAVNSGLPPTNIFVKTFAVSGSNLFAGTWDSGVFLSTNNGTNWTPVNTGLTNTRVLCLAISDTNLFAGTSGGSVFLSTNDGSTWTAINSGLPSNTDFYSLAVSGTNIFAGTWEGIFLTTNNGEIWNAVNSGLPPAVGINNLTVSGSNIFAGTYNGVYQSTNNGTSWTAVNEGLNYTHINSLVVSETNLFAGAEGGSVWRRPLTEMVPVEFTSFTATANGKEVTLNWSTATELNNQGFEVQRKFGSTDFVTVGSVKGHGTSTSPNNYTYSDKLIDPGKYFYRLKQIDYGGTFEYSNEIEVEVRVLDKFTLEQNFPNPFNPTTKINWQSPVGSWQTLKVYDVIGNEVATLMDKEMEAGYHSIDFNARDLPSGVYFYQLKVGNFTETKKMILLY